MIQDGVYSTFSYPVVYITRITRSRMIDLYGTSIRLETTSTWQLRLYTWISEIEERLNDDLSRYLIVGWTCPSNDFPVYLARVKLARCNEYSHQTSPTVKLGVVQPVSRTAFPTNVLVGKRCSFRVKKGKKEEKRGREKNKRLSYQRGTLATTKRPCIIAKG